MNPKNLLIFLVSLALFVACGPLSPSEKYSPEEEQCLAHDYLQQANKINDGGKQYLEQLDRAKYHFANIVVRNDANDTLRVDALYTLRWIEAYVHHDYEQALQYLNQYLTIVGPEHESYPTCLAYKADDLWHFGAQDSALYYAHKALNTPHKADDGVDYICHFVLWNIYENLEMTDSANLHKAQHMKVRDSREFVPKTLEELKSELKSNVIAPQQERRSPLTWTLPLILLVCIIGVGIYFKKKRIKQQENKSEDLTTHDPSVKENVVTVEALTQTLLAGNEVFKTTPVHEQLVAMKVCERDLPKLTSEQTREIEHTLLRAFHGTCSSLIKNYDLKDQDFVCILCTYLGCSNTIIAHIGHTTTATIRKRKERIRKKISADLYNVIQNEKA